MSSTERTIRDAIVAAINSIAVSTLGFDTALDAVKDYPLEFERDENKAKYLSASVNGRKVVRQWSVFVTASEQLTVSKGTNPLVIDRVYRVFVTGYYAQGIGGAGLNLLIDHAREIREAVYLLGSRLGTMADLFLGVDELDLRTLQNVDSENGQIIQGQMVFSWMKRGADF